MIFTKSKIPWKPIKIHKIKYISKISRCLWDFIKNLTLTFLKSENFNSHRWKWYKYTKIGRKIHENFANFQNEIVERKFKISNSGETLFIGQMRFFQQLLHWIRIKFRIFYNEINWKTKSICLWWRYWWTIELFRANFHGKSKRTCHMRGKKATRQDARRTCGFFIMSNF